ncbi:MULTISPECIES: hypothetical protein [Nocardiopsis]|uniref:Uncharacterized protein n=1 Tax=Nocardiopsis sinuspersici TaxID=501010 RepID=A0A1V3BVE9_9ACTN|nr:MULTISPECIES: hypothetical protein [Nocardiopsis]OOC52475.1 hypothetical protein NOSIN_00345 [Nocardiopsis sinuspersici]
MSNAFTRVVSFDRIGLHTEVGPLTVTAHSPLDFEAAISIYAERYLAPTTTVQVDAHPDAAQGSLHASVPGTRGSSYQSGPLLGVLTVSLPEAEEPVELLEAQIERLQDRRSQMLERLTGVPF